MANYCVISNEITVQCHFSNTFCTEKSAITSLSNLVVETTMRFIFANFAPSGAHNKMIENENVRSFPR